MPPSNKDLIKRLRLITKKEGKFYKDIYEGGAHYVKNSPFSSEGIKCGNCMFFQSRSNMCDIVRGNILRSSVCRFWVISDSKLQGRPTRENNSTWSDKEEY